MSWEQMQDTFYNCLDFCEMYDRLPYFYLTGGDPILHPDFWKLLGLMKENDIPLAGAVHDFICPQTGKGYIFFPIRKL